MYQINSEWDQLKACVVGRSWGPEFYHWVKDKDIRTHLETIAEETQEDLDCLEQQLKNFKIATFRPTNTTDNVDTLNLPKSPLSPRDHLLMLGNKLVKSFYGNSDPKFYNDIVAHVANQGNTVIETDLKSVCGATVYQYPSKIVYSKDSKHTLADTKRFLSVRGSKGKPLIAFHHEGHIDGWFCAVTPGLIITINDPENHELLKLFFKTYFNGWEVLYLNPTLRQLPSFRLWQKNHSGTWWLPGHENNTKLIEFIDQYFKNVLGFAAETVFELNMLVIDAKNVITSGYNQQIFDALKRHNVTPHVVPFRHKCFWDNGIHCVTADLHREEN